MGSNRYQRQIILSQIGEQGQNKLSASRVAVVGLGAVGGITVEYLARAGVGYLRLIDKDVVEESNLPRQILYTHKDALEGLQKPMAAKRYLHLVDAELEIEAQNVELNAGNCEELLEGVDIILDGNDNYTTRFILNEFSAKSGIPWIYSAVLGTEGASLGIIPGQGPCLTCLLSEEPEVGNFETTETVGVLGSVAGVVGSLQSARAIRYLVAGDMDYRLVSVNVWSGDFRSQSLSRRRDCPTCVKKKFKYIK